MILCQAVTGALICCSVVHGLAQSTVSVPEKYHPFTLYVGAGPNYYFNNLVLAKDKVNEVNYSIVGRLMWEPKHKLSLGVETGYLRLYHIKSSSSANGDLRIVNVAIPIQIVISMKFWK